MNRDELLAQIELRIERLMGDDMVFENFLNIEQGYSDKQLAKILEFEDSQFFNFMDVETLLY